MLLVSYYWGNCTGIEQSSNMCDINWCKVVFLASADDYAGFGNGFHATGGCGTKRAHMRQCLRLMRSIVSTYDDAVLTDLTEQGAINQLACQFLLLLFCYHF